MCAVQGMCTAGAFYFVNEADIVDLLRRRDVLRLARDLRLVSALEPVGLMRTDRARRDAAHGAVGQRRARVGARPRCASASSPRSCRAASCGRARTRSRPASRASRRRRRRARCAAIWESLDRPYRAAMEQGLIYTRLGNPIGMAEVARARAPTAPTRGSADEHATLPDAQPRIARGARARPVGARDRVRAAGGRPGASSPPTADAVDARTSSAGRARSPVGSCCATGPRTSGSLLGVLRAGACVVTIEPAARRRAACARTSRRSASPSSPASPTTSTRSRPTAAPSVRERRARRRRRSRRRRAPAPAATAPGRRGAHAHQRHDRSAEAHRRSRYEMLDAGARGRQALRARHRQPTCGCASGVVDRELAAGAPRRRVPRAAVRERRPLVLRCSSASPSTAGSTPCAGTGRRPSAWCPPRCAWCSTPTSTRPSSTSVRSVVSGTAPLDARRRRRVLRRSTACPCSISYARDRVRRRRRRLEPRRPRAVLGDEARQRRARARRAATLRVVDPDDGRTARSRRGGPARGEGAAQLGDDAGWIRTTDLARIDADGFLWILGRADQAIIRGGFKVRPDDVRAALERDPRVRGAAVVSRPDARLGAVPVAAVELRRRASVDVDDDLLDRGAHCSPATSCPAEIRIVDELPRTPVGQGRPRRRARAVRRAPRRG